MTDSNKDKSYENLTHEEKNQLIEQLQKTNFALEQQIIASNIATDDIINELEQKNSESKAVLQQVKGLNNLFENVSDVMSGLLIVTDMNGRISSINRAVEIELGHNRKGLLESKLDDLIHSQDLSELGDAIDQTSGLSESILVSFIYEKSQLKEEIRFRAASRKQYYVYYAVSGAPLFSKKGKQIGCVINAYSVDERRKKESELIQSEEKFRLTTDSASDGIVLINSRDEITYWNKGAEKIFGFSEEEIMGKSLHKTMIPMADGPMVAEGLSGFEKTGTGSVVGITRDVHAQRKNGEVFPCEVSVNAVNLDFEWHAVGVIRDITERKRYEKELMQAKQDAEKANQAKGMFLANMSHEIRTPMNGIIGMTGLALKTDLDQKQKGYLDKIKFSAETLLNIINDILDYSKIEAGMLDLEVVNFSLSDVLDNVRSLIEVKAQEKNIKFDVHIAPETPVDLIGDPVRITQILLNLCSNAVKFTEQGSVNIRIRVLRKHQKTISLQFDVADTGIGISKQYQKKMFQSFTQEDLSTTRKYGGTGLGLSISKKLVDMMHGDIWCNSVEGQGTTFSFTVELTEESVISDRNHHDYKFSSEWNVLVVDDDARALDIYTEVLTQMGAKIAIAKNVDDIKNKVLQTQWHCILLDLNMPDFSGYDVVHLVEKQAPENLKKIVIQTAYGKAVSKESLHDIDDERILSKPVKSEHLYAIIEALAHGDVPNFPNQNTEYNGLSGKTILLVDDNEINRLIATEVLEDFGVVVEEACDGKEAVDKVNTGSYDVILMDIQMPVMDGVEATRTIIKDHPGHHAPIVAMTAHVMQDEIEGFYKAGMVGHVGKPIDTDELKKILLSVLTSSSS